MKIPLAKGKISGLTLIELLVLIVVIAILAAMLLPARGGSRSAYRAVCMSNQRQIALSLSVFQSDHAGEYPWQASATNGVLIESISGSQAFPHFRALSDYIGKQTRVFVCPNDKSRHEAINCAQLLDTNISYFLNLDVFTNNVSILTGDRHLAADGKAVTQGAFLYSTNMVLSWTREAHGNQSAPLGVLAFTDGHAQVVKSKDLDPLFKNQMMATNHIIVP